MQDSQEDNQDKGSEGAADAGIPPTSLRSKPPDAADADLSAEGARSRSHSRSVKIMAEPGDLDNNRAIVPDKEPQPPQAATSRTPSVLPSQHKSNPDLRREAVVKGSHPGDKYVRYERNVGSFRRKGGGLLAASIETDQARSGFGKVFNRVKRVLIGAPISSEQSIHERLTKVKALAVLSSDALSSVAYATEEILRVLVIAATAGALSFTLPVGLAVMLLLAIVATSYRQTIAAYPRGGGSYIVAKDNLGTTWGLIAAASILIDYTMTVAVSVSAGIAAIYSLFPPLKPYTVEICIAVVVLVTIANLRGVREAGNIFAVPTYLFVVGILAMIALGVLRLVTGIGGAMVYTPPPATVSLGVEGISLLLVLRAFTQGCTALTGVEAISDGVPAFKPPESANARATLLWMAALAISMFAGITFLASRLQIRPSAQETVLSQVARTVFPSFGSGDPQSNPLLNPAWFFINIVTALILVLAANTAFSDFPRLSYFLARDRFMPHQYAFRGDRLAYSWGIVTLAILACILIIAFNGDTTALIPLYTVGVFNSFTLSQAGMVRRWWRLRTPGWQRSMAINLLGAVATLIVLIISIYTKFIYGAWIVIALIPILIFLFLAINRHYKRLTTEVEATTPLSPQNYKHTFIVPVASLSPVALSALAYARSLSNNVTAVHIVEGEDPTEAERFTEEFHKLMPDSDIPLVVIESPYRSLMGPLMSYIDALDQQEHDDTVTIVVPEFIPAKPWEYLLHNQSALRLKAALLFRPNTVVVNVPYLLGRNRPGARGTSWFPVVVLVVALLLIYFLFISKMF